MKQTVPQKTIGILLFSLITQKPAIPQEKKLLRNHIMLKESLKAAIDYLYSSGEFEMTIELIEDGLNEGMVKPDSVTTVLNEMAIESDLFLERILQIMTDYTINVQELKLQFLKAFVVLICGLLIIQV
ncbi:hypothetical protein [Myxosarcina sp. GI1(2024)]